MRDATLTTRQESKDQPGGDGRHAGPYAWRGRGCSEEHAEDRGGGRCQTCAQAGRSHTHALHSGEPEDEAQRGDHDAEIHDRGDRLERGERCEGRTLDDAGQGREDGGGDQRGPGGTAALDYADRGIRVNAVAPGPIDSGDITAQRDEIKQQIGSYTPLGHLGRPEEVAAAVTWLASPAASYTTGAILTVDGGKGARGA